MVQKFTERNEARVPRSRRDRVELDHNGLRRHWAEYYGCSPDVFDPPETYLPDPEED
jgi:hypothetical protein